ncbi:MAG: hypothetical protein IPM42_07955 [Saprospiraceae bacterium]|nr:hypothetical protein [Saprospiraceae bacterium]
MVLVLCPDKELNKMWFFFKISALKILAVATATPAFFALIFKKNNGHYNLTFYLDRALEEKVVVEQILIQAKSFLDKIFSTL